MWGFDKICKIWFPYTGYFATFHKLFIIQRVVSLFGQWWGFIETNQWHIYFFADQTPSPIVVKHFLAFLTLHRAHAEPTNYPSLWIHLFFFFNILSPQCSHSWQLNRQSVYVVVDDMFVILLSPFMCDQKRVSCQIMAQFSQRTHGILQTNMENSLWCSPNGK